MKKTILAVIIVITLFSCTKQKAAIEAPKQIYQFRAEAVSIDGTIQYSNISTVTL